ncbi:hypothetical protein [Undibacterium crateris]|uniref:hypothetical protein n=1 Tax=Undibacterium crateris TaxID=2528175 RepID=UPI001389CAA5|nr:hypothetical protein [Undibacterium crateris]NDI85474.1 hypothetical protein [Undibacterium crateris]
MSIYANTTRPASSLAFVRALVRVLSTNQQDLSPELQTYLYDVARGAAIFVQQKHHNPNLRPEVVEMAFEIADELELVDELSGMTSPKAFNPQVAQRLLDGLQRFAAA